MELNDLKIVPQYDRSVVCCFTGNRPHKLPWGDNEDSPRCRALKASMLARITELADRGYKLFVSGMAQGGDTYFAEAVLRLRESRDVCLECAIPFAAQPDGWSVNARRRYAGIVDAADFVTYVSYAYGTSCLFKRNRYMVEKSSALVTLDYGGGGGTSYTVAYAKKLGLTIVELG